MPDKYELRYLRELDKKIQALQKENEKLKKQQENVVPHIFMENADSS
jgi:hypothetical protein